MTILTDIKTNRDLRVAQLRTFLKAVKSEQIISSYEVNKVKAKTTATGNKYTVKITMQPSSASDVWPFLVRAYLPEAGVKLRSPNEIRMSENVHVSLNTNYKEINLRDAVHVLGKMIDVCITTPATNDGRRAQALEHLIKNYL